MPGREWRAAATTMLAAPRVRRSLRRNGYASTLTVLQHRARGAVADEHIVGIASAAVATMKRLRADTTCLERSLVVWWLLGGEDVATIRFGVAPPEAKTPLSFHAWVEVKGTVVADDPNVARRYLPFEADGAPSPDQFD